MTLTIVLFVLHIPNKVSIALKSSYSILSSAFIVFVLSIKEVKTVAASVPLLLLVLIDISQVLFLRQSKVSYFKLESLSLDEEIRRFNVSVDQSFLMDVC
jgi:hypothetical protein